MSRAIKFRAWNSIDKKMVISNVVNMFWSKMVGSKDYDLMQFTGIHDVNGVEIYKGDIVSVPGFGNGKVEISAQYGVEFINSKYSQPYIDGAAENDFPTVIGNIYEHPHLLKTDN